MTPTGPLVASRVLVTGSIAGSGFESFVDGLASELGLSGRVGQGLRGVEIHVEGGELRCSAFLGRLRREAPQEARITGIQVTRCAPIGMQEFKSGSVATEVGAPLALQPDAAVCMNCEATLFDPGSRRFRDPFIRCDACGPRYAVASPGWEPENPFPGFVACDECTAEREVAAETERDALAPGCPRCGPEISIVDRSGNRVARGEEALRAAQIALEAGRIAAVKGVSGFHLMVRADDTAAVAELRRRAGCGDRPFPVLFRDQLAIRSVLGPGVLSSSELEELSSPAAPVVLVRPPGAQLRCGISAEVAPYAPDLGCMLASSPLHKLLLAEVDAPVVAWAGALDGGPPAADLDEARRMFGEVADLFLDHEVSIVHATPDSVVRIVEGERVVLKAGKGLAPRWIDAEALLGSDPEGAAVDLALGSPRSGSIALREGHRVLLAPSIGDLSSERVVGEGALRDLESGTGRSARRVVTDGTADAARAARVLGVRTISAPPQVARALGAALDAGLAAPHAALVWQACEADGRSASSGCDLFLMTPLAGRGLEVERVGAVDDIPLLGAAGVPSPPWQLALGLLRRAFGWAPPPLLLERSFEAAAAARCGREARAEWQGVRPPDAVETASAGQVFEAATALLGVCSAEEFGGDAALRLEQLAVRALGTGAALDPYPLAARRGEAGCTVFDHNSWLAALAADLERGTAADTVSLRIHDTFATLAARLVQASGLEPGSDVTLSGGLFENRLLLERTHATLGALGYATIWSTDLPVGSGGLAVGQLVWAAGR
ncbi:MAG: Sua5/YciO/YrdC/YwlC family protein [Planctomycetota bacterium]|nr:Sua5/YciO/YrdC/YwlC family protein [Planctomycetota bacterium]